MSSGINRTQASDKWMELNHVNSSQTLVLKIGMGIYWKTSMEIHLEPDWTWEQSVAYFEKKYHPVFARDRLVKFIHIISLSPPPAKQSFRWEIALVVVCLEILNRNTSEQQITICFPVLFQFSKLPSQAPWFWPHLTFVRLNCFRLQFNFDTPSYAKYTGTLWVKCSHFPS